MSHQKYSVPAIQARLSAPPPAVITNNRVTVFLGGKTYPFELESTPELPEAFRPLPGLILASFQFKKSNKSDLFRQYAGTMEALATLTDSINRFFHTVSLAARAADPIALDVGKLPPARSEWYAEPDDKIFQAMLFAMTKASEILAKRIVSTLDQLVNMQHIGLIDSLCADACRYHYFIHKDETVMLKERVDRDDQVDGKQHTVTTTTHREKERVKSLTRHVHDLIDAKQHVFPAEKINKPNRVLPVFSSLPDVLKPLARVVDGQQIRDLRIERDLSRERWTDVERDVRTWEETPPRVVEQSMYRYDPALVIGGQYVVAGWIGEEWQREEDKRNNIAQQKREYEAEKAAEKAERDARCPSCYGRGYPLDSSGYNAPRCPECKGTGKRRTGWFS